MLMFGATFHINHRTGEVSLSVNENGNEAPERRYEKIESVPPDFVAIDFETANSSMCSPCSIGIAIVKNYQVKDSFSKLIKPHPDYSEFSDFNTQIHGITRDDVQDSPEFNVVMPDIFNILDNGVACAHNMVFDSSVLFKTAQLYGMNIPACKTLCSCNISRILYPNLLSHKLNIVCEHMKIQLDHHKAESDAIASAKILIEASKHNETISNACYSYGYIDNSGHWSPSVLSKCHKHEDEIPASWADKASCAKSASDCDFVFTGTLASMPREVAWKLVETAGGRASNSVSKKTEYLVMGIQDYSKFTDGQKSSKTKKAEALKADGYPIEIISEDDFLKMFDIQTETEIAK